MSTLGSVWPGQVSKCEELDPEDASFQGTDRPLTRAEANAEGGDVLPQAGSFPTSAGVPSVGPREKITAKQAHEATLEKLCKETGCRKVLLTVLVQIVPDLMADFMAGSMAGSLADLNKKLRRISEFHKLTTEGTDTYILVRPELSPKEQGLISTLPDNEQTLLNQVPAKAEKFCKEKILSCSEVGRTKEGKEMLHELLSGTKLDKYISELLNNKDGVDVQKKGDETYIILKCPRIAEQGLISTLPDNEQTLLNQELLKLVEEIQEARKIEAKAKKEAKKAAKQLEKQKQKEQEAVEEQHLHRPHRPTSPPQMDRTVDSREEAREECPSPCNQPFGNTLTKREIAISKALAKLLRHNALQYKLVMGRDAFVRLEDVLRCPLIRTTNATEADLERVVANDGKQRFQIKKEGGTQRIRAVQGHSRYLSIHYDLDDSEMHTEIVATDLLECCVHGTFQECWGSIREEGLHVGNRKHIHFANSIERIRDESEIAIWVDIKKAIKGGIRFFRSHNGVILTQGIDGVLDRKYFDLKKSEVLRTKQKLS